MDRGIFLPSVRGGIFKRRTGICLNMVVRDNTAVLEQLLRSVRDAIDYFVIVDTGSTDGTPQLIRRLAVEWRLPGELHCRPRVSLGHNRQEALELALTAECADWLLFIDADEELQCADPAWFTHLEPGVSYQMHKHVGEIRYALTKLVDIRDSRWAWQGSAHEYLSCMQGGAKRKTLKDAWTHCYAG